MIYIIRKECFSKLKMLKNLVVALGILFVTPIISQGQELTIGVELRPRGEMMHGYKTLADSAQKAAFGISQRTRINLGFKSKWVHGKVVLQDVRTWGSQPQLVIADGNTTTIHEAWGSIFFHKNISMKAGRQEII